MLIIKNNKKWNRRNYFAKQKSTKKRVGHPVYVYSSSGELRKYLVFSSDEKLINDNKYEKLNKNIDPDDNRSCFVKKQFSLSNQKDLLKPDKKYRIHESDRNKITRLKK